MQASSNTVRLVLALSLVSGAPLHGQDSGSQAERPLAVVGVDVLTMEREATLSDQTVVVRGETIVALGPRELVAPPEGAEVIDGTGKTLLPGLFDTHVHLNDPEPDEHLVLYLATGVTTVQSMHGSPRHLEVRERLQRGELLGPVMLTTGPTNGSPTRKSSTS